jgi:hypothetical protein
VRESPKDHEDVLTIYFCPDAQRPNLAAVLGLVLHQVVEHPLRRDIVAWQCSNSPKLGEVHLLEGSKQALPHDAEPAEMIRKRQSLDLG